MAGDEMKAIVDGIAGAAKEIVVPVYQDGVQPAMQEVGKFGGTAGRLINAMFAPLRVGLAHVEGWEKRVSDGLNERIKGVPEEKLQPPPPEIGVPIMESLRYTIDVEHMREMFLNLLSSSMIEGQRSRAHPSFVEAVRQMTPDEARLLLAWADVPDMNVYFALHGGFHPSFAPVLPVFADIAPQAKVDPGEALEIALANLSRSGFIQKGTLVGTIDAVASGPNLHDAGTGDGVRQLSHLLRSSGLYDEAVRAAEFPNTLTFHYETWTLNRFGRTFLEVCLLGPGYEHP